MADDRVSAELAAIEHRGRIAYNDYDAPPRKDWDALIAAVDAVLNLADDWKAPRVHPRTSEEIIRSACGMDLAAAIEHALTGEDASDRG